MIPNDRKGPQITQHCIRSDPKSPQNDSKWFQVIPNDSKLFKVIPNHLKMIPSLLGLHLLHSFSLRSHAWTFCTCSPRIHMLELIALIDLVLTCWGFWHSIALPVSCSSGFYRYWAPGYLLPLPSVRGRTGLGQVYKPGWQDGHPVFFLVLRHLILMLFLDQDDFRMIWGWFWDDFVDDFGMI